MAYHHENTKNGKSMKTTSANWVATAVAVMIGTRFSGEQNRMNIAGITRTSQRMNMAASKSKPINSQPGKPKMKAWIFTITSRVATQITDLFSVPGRGIEPPRPCGHKLLRLARLPIPPPGQG